MSIQYLCDICGEITQHAEAQPEFTTFVQTDRGGSEVGVRVIRSIGGVSNGGTILQVLLRPLKFIVKFEVSLSRDDPGHIAKTDKTATADDVRRAAVGSHHTPGYSNRFMGFEQ